MKSLQKLLLIVGFVAIALTALVITVEKSLGPKEDKVIVTSQSILDRISDHYFVVTKSVVVNQDSEITVDKGSKWSNLFWGQTIDARGVIRVDIGVDLSSLTEEDIVVNHKKKTVSIALPQATILNASQFGDIEVDTKQGILKYVLDNDPNDDHNRALDQLITDATVAVRSDETLFEEARTDSSKLLRLIVESLDYTLE